MNKYQTMPDITGDKWDEFKRDIQENGVKVPVIKDEHGDILDGHQRDRACKELGIDCPGDIINGLTEKEKYVLIMSLNYHRRQLSPQEQHSVSKAAAENYRRRKAAGEKVTQAQVAKEFGIHRNRISENKNALPVQNPETPAIVNDTGLQENSNPSEKKIIVDVYPLEKGKKGYQVKTTDGQYFFKQNKDLNLCETIKDSINKKGYVQDKVGMKEAKALVKDIADSQKTAPKGVDRLTTKEEKKATIPESSKLENVEKEVEKTIQKTDNLPISIRHIELLVNDFLVKANRYCYIGEYTHQIPETEKKLILEEIELIYKWYSKIKNELEADQ